MHIPALPYSGLVITAETPKWFYPEELVRLGDHMRKRRLDEDLTQGQLAELLDVTASTVNNWERGRNSPDVQARSRIIPWRGSGA
jgi:DNA-binding XRE family transcriptional regulator